MCFLAIGPSEVLIIMLLPLVGIFVVGYYLGWYKGRKKG